MTIYTAVDGWAIIFWYVAYTMTNENGDVSGCYVMLAQDRVKPQTIIQQNVAIGTVAVDVWLLYLVRRVYDE